MKIRTIATSSMEQFMTRNQALAFGGKAAGVCYMANSLKDILKESAEKTENRVKRTLESGHHSVYEHTYFTIMIVLIVEKLLELLYKI